MEDLFTIDSRHDGTLVISKNFLINQDKSSMHNTTIMVKDLPLALMMVDILTHHECKRLISRHNSNL